MWASLAPNRSTCLAFSDSPLSPEVFGKPKKPLWSGVWTVCIEWSRAGSVRTWTKPSVVAPLLTSTIRTLSDWIAVLSSEKPSRSEIKFAGVIVCSSLSKYSCNTVGFQVSYRHSRGKVDFQLHSCCGAWNECKSFRRRFQIPDQQDINASKFRNLHFSSILRRGYCMLSATLGQHCHFKRRIPSKLEGYKSTARRQGTTNLHKNEEPMIMLTSSDQNKSSESTLPSSCTFFCTTVLVLLGDLLLLLDLDVPKPCLRCPKS